MSRIFTSNTAASALAEKPGSVEAAAMTQATAKGYELSGAAVYPILPGKLLAKTLEADNRRPE